jgi:heme exporter protein A
MGDTISDPVSPAIEVRGLTKSFGNNPALRGIDLTIGKGERLSVFGPNGAGKTTLVKILSTLMKPTSGSISLNDMDIRSKSAQVRQQVALVSHQNFLYDDLTVYENLKFYGKMYNVPQLGERIGEVISWAKLDSRMHDRLGTLSHGMQKRASIARAILHNPSILLLDEPEAGLDPDAGNMIEDAVNDNGRTVVMTSHNLDRGLELCDRVIILNRGKVEHQSYKSEIDPAGFRQLYNRVTGIEI